MSTRNFLNFNVPPWDIEVPMSHGGTLNRFVFKNKKKTFQIKTENLVRPSASHSATPNPLYRALRIFRRLLFLLQHWKRCENTIFIFRFFSFFFLIFRFFFEKARSDKTRGHTLKLKTVSDWNALPDNAVSSATLNQFKNRHERHMKAVAVCG